MKSMVFSAALCTLLSMFTPAAANAGTLSNLIFANGFEQTIEPVFPVVDGEFVLPPGPTVNQLEWILDELASDETTTAAEVEAHFVDGFDPPAIAGFINDMLRPLWPDAIVTDIVTMTPVNLSVIIESPDGSDPRGLVDLQAAFSGDRLIRFFRVANAANSPQLIDDQSLSLIETADKFSTLAETTSLLVARIDDNNMCVPVVDRAASTLRGTGSIFKIWVLGGVARALADGTITSTQAVELVASELALAGTINTEPLGTQFSVDELATLMLGISDNTATDLLHELVGRDVIGQFIDSSGVADPDVLKPLLSINEQFHFYFTLALSVWQDYLDGSEMFQQNFIDNQLVPLGPVTSFPTANPSLLAGGTWQASPMDICATYAALRQTTADNDAFDVVNRALSAGIALPGIRNEFDRVWSKGGSLSDGAGFRVYTLSWLIESTGEQPYVVVLMANNPTPGDVDAGAVFSLGSRIIQLISEGL